MTILNSKLFRNLLIILGGLFILSGCVHHPHHANYTVYKTYHPDNRYYAKPMPHYDDRYPHYNPYYYRDSKKPLNNKYQKLQREHSNNHKNAKFDKQDQRHRKNERPQKHPDKSKRQDSKYRDSAKAPSNGRMIATPKPTLKERQKARDDRKQRKVVGYDDNRRNNVSAHREQTRKPPVQKVNRQTSERNPKAKEDNPRREWSATRQMR